MISFFSIRCIHLEDAFVSLQRKEVGLPYLMNPKPAAQEDDLGVALLLPLQGVGRNMRVQHQPVMRQHRQERP